MIVNFWATWCAPCRREIPLLRKIQAEHGAEGFQIVGVAVDFREDVLKYAKEIGIDYPVLIGEQDGLEAVNKFGQGSLGFPFTVFTDNQQRIVMFHLGEIHAEAGAGVPGRGAQGEQRRTDHRRRPRRCSQATRGIRASERVTSGARRAIGYDAPPDFSGLRRLSTRNRPSAYALASRRVPAPMLQIRPQQAAVKP